MRRSTTRSRIEKETSEKGQRETFLCAVFSSSSSSSRDVRQDTSALPERNTYLSSSLSLVFYITMMIEYHSDVHSSRSVPILVPRAILSIDQMKGAGPAAIDDDDVSVIFSSFLIETNQ